LIRVKLVFNEHNGTNYVKPLRMKTLNQIIVVAFLVLGIFACEEIEKYSEIPEVSFKDFRYDDTTLVFEFIDGDGDLGLDQFDTTKPFNPGNKYFYNLFIDYYEYSNGKTTQIEFKFPTDIRFNTIPEPEGNNKTLKGDMEVDLQYSLPLDLPDTFIIKFQIVDRNLHESNIDSTTFLSYENN
jgi:hypothetical protein